MFRPTSHGKAVPEQATTRGSTMAHHLSGKRVAVIATDMFEQVELTEPWKALEEHGARV